MNLWPIQNGDFSWQTLKLFGCYLPIGLSPKPWIFCGLRSHFEGVDGGQGRCCRGATSSDNSAAYYALCWHRAAPNFYTTILTYTHVDGDCVYIYIWENMLLKIGCFLSTMINHQIFSFCGLCENCHPYPHIPQGSNMPRCWLDCSSQTLGTSISLRIYMVIIIYGAWHTHM
jgi:hypothetical protein